MLEHGANVPQYSAHSTAPMENKTMKNTTTSNNNTTDKDLAAADFKSRTLEILSGPNAGDAGREASGDRGKADNLFDHSILTPWMSRQTAIQTSDSSTARASDTSTNDQAPAKESSTQSSAEAWKNCFAIQKMGPDAQLKDIRLAKEDAKGRANWKPEKSRKFPNDHRKERRVRT